VVAVFIIEFYGTTERNPYFYSNNETVRWYTLCK